VAACHALHEQQPKADTARVAHRGTLVAATDALDLLGAQAAAVVAHAQQDLVTLNDVPQFDRAAGRGRGQQRLRPLRERIAARRRNCREMARIGRGALIASC